jgi:hypothetical protein
VVQVTSPECRGRISASTSLSLSIEGVCSELVQTLCFRFSRGRVLAGRFTDTHVMRCLG